MIWPDPIYEKTRTLEEWTEGVHLPVGIEKLVETAKHLPEKITDVLLNGMLFLIEEDDRVNDRIAAIIKGTKDHADGIECFTCFQVLSGLTRREFIPVLESADLLIVFGTKSITREEERLIDRVLMVRGYYPARVTVMVGDSTMFTELRNSYGGVRTYELRSKTSKQGPKR